MANWQYFTLWLFFSVIWNADVTLANGCAYSGPPNIELFLQHHEQCDLFYRLDKCPKGLFFNPTIKLCDLPSNTNCGQRIIPPDHENAHPSTVTGKYVGGRCDPLKPCPPTDPDSPVKFVQHRTDCASYCGCLNIKPVLYRCPFGYHFNPTISRCDLPSRAGCKSLNIATSGHEHTITDNDFVGGLCPSIETCPALNPLHSKIFLPHRSKCNLFCGCNDGESILYRCPNNLHFNPKLNICDLPAYSGCTSEGISSGRTGNVTGNCPTPTPCPETDPVDRTLYLPHSTDCKLFCRCSHGAAILHTCAEGLLFNPKYQTCDLPKNVRCLVGTSTAQTSNGSTDGIIGTHETCPALGNCPKVGSLSNKVLLPHETNCSLYCECWQGVPKLRRCLHGLHFNAATKRCENPKLARCQGVCSKIASTTGALWEPERCLKDLSKQGDVCNISCLSGYELMGSANISCTAGGWMGTGGRNILPKCIVPEEVGINLVENVAKEISGSEADFLFLLDESGSLSVEQFGTQLSFVKAVVSAFPLSQKRHAGVISFSGSASVDVNMKHGDTCKFLSDMKKIMYQGGTTDIQLALTTANREILKNSIHNRTLVFLVTDGESDTDPTSAANILKKNGNVLFTVGIGDYERNQLEPIATIGKDGAPLFFGITNFNVFNKIADYLHTVHGHGAKLNCS